MANFVAQIDLSLAEKIMNDLKSRGFEISKPQYTLFSAKKKGLSCTLYTSGKLMVQGKEMKEFIEFYLEPEILGDFSFTHKEVYLDPRGRIGADEAGKGDFFGPLCTAAVCAEGDGIKKLVELGVRDSKNIRDSEIIKIGKKIEKEYPTKVVAIGPEKYNELYPKFQNLNRMLAWAHASCIELLVKETNCKEVIIDQFANEQVMNDAVDRKNLPINLIQRTKGEEDIVVAAASIIARKYFVEKLEVLERKFEVSLPKGGSSSKLIAAGKQFVKKYGEDQLKLVGKLHFKTLDSIIG